MWTILYCNGRLRCQNSYVKVCKLLTAPKLWMWTEDGWSYGGLFHHGPATLYICRCWLLWPFQIWHCWSQLKRYGVIFTCLTIQALHMDSFLLALRRFIARRGQVQKIHSDNGTNFTNGKKEHHELLMAHMSVVYGSAAFAPCGKFCKSSSESKSTTTKVSQPWCAKLKVLWIAVQLKQFSVTCRTSSP